MVPYYTLKIELKRYVPKYDLFKSVNVDLIINDRFNGDYLLCCQVYISYVDSQLSWERFVTGKTYTFDLTKVTNIKTGKLTANFLKEESDPASIHHSFSFVTEVTTLDLETSNQHDRDCIVLLMGKILDLPPDCEVRHQV